MHSGLPMRQVILVCGTFGSGCKGVASTAHADMQDEAVSLLLKWGADCKLQDNDGVTPLDTARHFPEILAAMHQKQVLLSSYVTAPYSPLNSENSVVHKSACALISLPYFYSVRVAYMIPDVEHPHSVL